MHVTTGKNCWCMEEGAKTAGLQELEPPAFERYPLDKERVPQCRHLTSVLLSSFVSCCSEGSLVPKSNVRWYLIIFCNNPGLITNWRNYKKNVRMPYAWGFAQNSSFPYLPSARFLSLQGLQRLEEHARLTKLAEDLLDTKEKIKISSLNSCGT